MSYPWPKDAEVERIKELEAALQRVEAILDDPMRDCYDCEADIRQALQGGQEA